MKDEDYMRLALLEAQQAFECGEVPVGAVVVWNNKVIASAHNMVEANLSGMAHAEIIALDKARLVIGGWRLDGCVLYVTKEPCAMCAGAMVNSRLPRLVFGCADPRSGAAGGAMDVTGFPGMLHRVQVTGGVLADDCASILQNFFRSRRRENND